MNIAIVATTAEDHITDLKTGKKEIRMGGPAKWIHAVCQQLVVESMLYTNVQPARIEIDVSDSSETGKMVSVPEITTPPITADIIVISTVGDEFRLNQILSFTGMIALDVQGYIRSLAADEKLSFVPTILEKLSIVKAAENEYEKLDSSLKDQLREKVVLLTKGSKGFDVLYKQEVFEFKGKSLRPHNTIGAGDTLLTAFSIMYARTGLIDESGSFAKDFVESFLQNKS